MSTAVQTNLQAVERLVQTMAWALSSSRLHRAGHARVKEATRHFRAAVEAFFEEFTDHDRLRIAVANGLVLYRGTPLGEGRLFDELAERFTKRGCSGLDLTRGFQPQSATSLLDWLCARGDAERTLDSRPAGIPGVRFLPLGQGRATALDAIARDNLLDRVPELREPLELHEQLVLAVDEVMSAVRDGQPPRLDPVARAGCAVAAAAKKYGTGILAGLQLPYDEAFGFHRDANVCLLVTSLVQPFVADEHQLASIARATLVADIGRYALDPELLRKPEDLTSTELELLRRHPEQGAALLAGLVPPDPIAIHAAYCHHMRKDGLGYPEPIVPIRIGPVASLIQVADLFEALVSKRPYKAALSVWGALEVMLAMPGMKEKRSLLRLLFDRLTPYPPGTEVRLSDGARATVLRTHPHAPERPVVKVILDADGRRLEEHRMLNLADLDPGSGEPVRSVSAAILEAGTLLC